MKYSVKYAPHIISILALGLLCYLFINSSPNENDKNQAAFEEQFHTYSLPLPEELTFAEESVSLADPDLMERYDRELLTNVYWQSQTMLLIKRAHKYFPTIERILKEQNIPDDFKYLAVAESGLLFNVVSPANAASYWQFLEKTGKVYGLEIDEDVDERYNLEKATVAACNYFKAAYAKFGNWSLVAASYNMGIDGVQKQVQIQKANTYSDLYLNPETSRYMFRILGIKTVLENPEKYGFHILPAHLYNEIPVVKIKVDQSIPDLAQFAADYRCNYKWLKLLNPWLKKSTLSVSHDQVYYISMPKDSVLKTPYATYVFNDTLAQSPVLDSLPQR